MNNKKAAAKPAKPASGKINLKAPVKATTRATPRLSTNHNETLLIA